MKLVEMLVTVGKPEVIGFTLIELLVTLAVAVILATIAVPGFQGMMARSRLASDFNDVLAGLKMARSEAIKRREVVALELTATSPWSYRVYLPEDAGADDLRVRNGDVTLTPDIADLEVVFDALGRVQEGSDCDSGCSIEVSYVSAGCRTITVSGFGRIGHEGCSE